MDGMQIMTTEIKPLIDGLQIACEKHGVTMIVVAEIKDEGGICVTDASTLVRKNGISIIMETLLNTLTLHRKAHGLNGGKAGDNAG